MLTLSLHLGISPERECETSPSFPLEGSEGNEAPQSRDNSQHSFRVMAHYKHSQTSGVAGKDALALFCWVSTVVTCQISTRRIMSCTDASIF